jgi:hypothetical protein
VIDTLECHLLFSHRLDRSGLRHAGMWPGNPCGPPRRSSRT